jgi:hypothetical protein
MAQSVTARQRTTGSARLNRCHAVIVFFAAPIGREAIELPMNSLPVSDLPSALCE